MEIEIPKELSKDIFKFVQQLLGPVAEASDFLTDKIRFHRWKSALNTLIRASEIIKENNMSVSEVPVKFLVPFLEKCSLENDDSPLVEQWAQLLVSATNNYNEQLITFTEILSQLGHEDAKILQKMKGKFVKYNNSLGNFLELYGILPNTSELGVTLGSSIPSERDLPVDQDGRYFLVKGVTIATPFSTGSIKVYDSNEPIYRLDHLGLVKIW